MNLAKKIPQLDFDYTYIQILWLADNIKILCKMFELHAKLMEINSQLKFIKFKIMGMIY